ncbi:MAG TPA: hypothetical protein VGG57_14810, partial [Stellaceae bacterium]
RKSEHPNAGNDNSRNRTPPRTKGIAGERRPLHLFRLFLSEIYQVATPPQLGHRLIKPHPDSD